MADSVPLRASSARLEGILDRHARLSIRPGVDLPDVFRPCRLKVLLVADEAEELRRSLL